MYTIGKYNWELEGQIPRLKEFADLNLDVSADLNLDVSADLNLDVSAATSWLAPWQGKDPCCWKKWCSISLSFSMADHLLKLL